MNRPILAHRSFRLGMISTTLILLLSAGQIFAQQGSLSTSQLDQVQAQKVNTQTVSPQVNSRPQAAVQLKWATTSTAGTEGSGSRFKLRGTLQQSAIGRIGTGTYTANLGFWEIYGGEASCCQGIRGNINGDPDDRVNIADLAYVIAYLFPQDTPSGPPPGCVEEGNVNGDPNDDVNVLDVTYLIAFLFGIPNGPAPPSCYSN